jgi:hypothetical protein
MTPLHGAINREHRDASLRRELGETTRAREDRDRELLRDLPRNRQVDRRYVAALLDERTRHQDLRRERVRFAFGIAFVRVSANALPRMHVAQLRRIGRMTQERAVDRAVRAGARVGASTHSLVDGQARA